MVRTGGNDHCDDSYPDERIESPPPDLNCDDIPEKNFKVKGFDPHGFDGDNDGIGCESGKDPNPEPKPHKSDCDDSYPDDCIPSPPPDLDCGDHGVPNNIKVEGDYPHGFDGDGDGKGCESNSSSRSNDNDNDRLQ